MSPFSLPLLLSAAERVGATGTRTVTRTLASAVPPSPLATRWKFVELEGETVCVPLSYRADAVDGDRGRVGGAPVQHDGLAEVDCKRVRGEVRRRRRGGRCGGPKARRIDGAACSCGRSRQMRGEADRQHKSVAVRRVHCG